MIRIKTDVKGFVDGCLKMRSAVVNGSEAGMREAMQTYLSDVLDSPPSCPYETGALYDAHKVSVVKSGTGVRGELTVEGIRYAAAVHEGVTSRGIILKWTRPGSGSHWISSKMLMFADKYLNVLKQAVAGHWKAFGTQWVRPYFRSVRKR